MEITEEMLVAAARQAESEGLLQHGEGYRLRYRLRAVLQAALDARPPSAATALTTGGSALPWPPAPKAYVDQLREIHDDRELTDAVGPALDRVDAVRFAQQMKDGVRPTPARRVHAEEIARAIAYFKANREQLAMLPLYTRRDLIANHVLGV